MLPLTMEVDWMTAVDKKKWEELLQAVEQNLKYLMSTDIIPLLSLIFK